MTKTMLLTLTLLACTAWVAAQSTSHSSPSSDSSGSQATAGSENGQMSGSANTGQMNGKGHTTIRGCLSSSGGGYTLTDASGAQYQLTGDTSLLGSHVNNEVEVRGNPSGAPAYGRSSSSASDNSQTAAGTTGAAGAGKMFNVTKVKKVSSTCKTSK